MDDWMFLYRYRLSNGGSDEFVFSSWINFIVNNSKIDNGRLANLFAPIFATENLGFRHIFPLLAGLSVASMVPFMFSFAGIKKHRAAYTCVAFALIVGFLPWREGLYMIDYALNYVFATAVTCFTFWLILRLDSKGWTYLNFTLCLIVVLLAAGWHEEFALSVSGGMGLWALLHPRKTCIQWWIITIIYFGIACLFLYTPGMIQRASEQTSGLYQMRLVQFVYSVPQIFTLVFVLISVLSKKGRSRLASCFGERPFFICFAAMVASFAVPYVISFSPKMMYWPIVLSLICLFRMLRPWTDHIFSYRWVRIVLYACFAVIVVQFSTVIYWQRKIYYNMEELYGKFKTYQSVFHNLIDRTDIPWWTLKFNERNMMYDTNNYFWLGAYKYGCQKLLYVIPCGMERVTVENSEYIGGELDMYISQQGELWSRMKLEPYNATVKYVFADGSEYAYIPLYGRFISNEGDTLTYISTPYGKPRVVSVEYDKGSGLQNRVKRGGM